MGAPWIVFGLQLTADGVSNTVSGGAVLTSLLTFTLLYAVLIVVDIYLLAKYARADTAEVASGAVPSVAQA
jgi:cytochrome d ubiquinol oxidase subunit I